jgi:hypothetical protein
MPLPAPLRKLLPGPVGQGDRLTRDALIAAVDRAAPAYGLELLDPRHRFGDLLHPLFALWVQAADPALPGFFAWVDALALEMPDGAALFGDDTLRGAFAELGVEIDRERAHMLAELWTESAQASGVDVVQRVRYRVTVSGGLVTWCGRSHAPEPLDTGASAASGDGYLWVLDRWNQLYTAARVPGRSYHALPALGRGVRAAGEWVVAGGRVLEVRGRTEHYRTPMRHYVAALRTMRSVLHIPLHEAVAGVFKNDPTRRESWVDEGITVGRLVANMDNSQTAYTTFPKYAHVNIG